MHARLALDALDTRVLASRAAPCGLQRAARGPRASASKRTAGMTRAAASFPFGTRGPPLRRERNACRHPHIHARHTVTLVRSDTMTALERSSLARRSTRSGAAMRPSTCAVLASWQQRRLQVASCEAPFAVACRSAAGGATLACGIGAAGFIRVSLAIRNALSSWTSATTRAMEAPARCCWHRVRHEARWSADLTDVPDPRA